MKTVIKVLVMVLFSICLFSGCVIWHYGIEPYHWEGTGTKKELAVYSFRGENELFSISNGVIVLNSTEEIFYGGNLEEKDGMFSDIVAYSVSFYIQSGDEKRILLSNNVEDMTGGTITVAGEIGKRSGDITKDIEIEELGNTLFFELRTTDLNGEKNEYQLQ